MNSLWTMSNLLGWPCLSLTAEPPRSRIPQSTVARTQNSAFPEAETGLLGQNPSPSPCPAQLSQRCRLASALPLGTLEGGTLLYPSAKVLPEARIHAVTHRVNTSLFSPALGFYQSQDCPKWSGDGTEGCDSCGDSKTSVVWRVHDLSLSQVPDTVESLKEACFRLLLSGSFISVTMDLGPCCPSYPTISASVPPCVFPLCSLTGLCPTYTVFSFFHSALMSSSLDPRSEPRVWL